MEKAGAVEETIIVEDDDTTAPNPYNHRNRCCFNLPCFGPGPKSHLTLGGSSSSSSSPSTLWDRIRVGESENKWWATPIKAIKKIREWSEIVAGPKWKTFIRRFNRNSRHQNGHVKFQYDPLSYALNFDEGQGQNGHFEEEGFTENYPDFAYRFAASARSSIDLGKATPAR